MIPTSFTFAVNIYRQLMSYTDHARFCEPRTFGGALDLERLQDWLLNAIENAETEKQAKAMLRSLNKVQKAQTGTTFKLNWKE